MVNVVSPLTSVAALVGDTDMRFLPAALMIAVIVLLSNIVPYSSNNVTITSLLCLFFSFRLVGDIFMYKGS